MSDLPYRLGVGAMIVNRDGLVFVGKRLDTSLDAWQMPQGGVDPGEDSDTAVLREVEEETGIAPRHVRILAKSAAAYDYDLPADIQGKIWGGKYRGQRQDWFLLAFDGEDSDVNIATEHAEFGEWQWVAADRLVELIVPFKKALYTAIVAEFSPALTSINNS